MTRNVLAGILIVAVLVVVAIVLFASQAQTLSQTQATLEAAQVTATAQAANLDAQATAGAVAATEAADAQAQAVAEAQDAAATVQADALADAEDAAATAQADAVADVEDAAATAQADALAEAEAAVATAQADAVADVEDAAATAQADALAEAEDAAATAQADALADAEIAAATAQAEVVAEAENAAATAQAGLVTTHQAELDTLGDQVADLRITATAQAGAVSDAENAAATAQAQADHIATLEAPATFGDQPLADVPVADLFYIDLFDPNHTWASGPAPGRGETAVQNGQYIISIDVTPADIQVSHLPVVTDNYMEMDVYLDRCPPDGVVGLIYRLQPQTFDGYYFFLSCDLTFWEITVFRSPTDSETLGYNAFSRPPADPARPRVLGVLGRGNEFSFYLDGVLLGSVTDDTFSIGVIGIHANARDNIVVVRFDNLRVWNLPPGEAASGPGQGAPGGQPLSGG